MINYLITVTYPEQGQKFSLWCNDAGYFQMEVTQYPNGFNKHPDECFDIELNAETMEEALDEMFRQIKEVIIGG